jgi:hypothetical protein
LVGATPAFAQSGSEKETARTLMDEADRLLAVRDLEGALKRYQAADAIMRVPTTGVEVARVLAELGRWVEARARAIEVANTVPAAGEPPVYRDARTSAAELAQSLAARIPSVLIQVEPSDAHPVVQVDGVELPSALVGLPYKVDPGEHTVSITAAGFEPAQQRFTVVEAQQQPVKVTLVAREAGAAGVTPDSAGSPVSGAGESNGDSASSEPKANNGALTRGLVGLGVGVVGVGVGSVAGIITLNSVHKAKQDCESNTCSSSAQSSISNAKTTAMIANIGFGVGIVALAYGAYELIFNMPDEPQAATARTPVGTQARWDVAVERDSWFVSLKGAF